MQRCPYIHEMKERLLGAPAPMDGTDHRDHPRDRVLEVVQDPQVGTIVKVSNAKVSLKFITQILDFEPSDSCALIQLKSFKYRY